MAARCGLAARSRSGDRSAPTTAGDQANPNPSPSPNPNPNLEPSPSPTPRPSPNRNQVARLVALLASMSGTPATVRGDNGEPLTTTLTLILTRTRTRALSRTLNPTLFLTLTLTQTLAITSHDPRGGGPSAVSPRGAAYLQAGNHRGGGAAGYC